MPERWQWPRMAIAVLALIGLLDAVYLALWKGGGSLDLVCPIGGNSCETVQTSVWSTLPPGGGAPVAVLGVLGYGVLLATALLALNRERIGWLSLPAALLSLGGGALLMSAYLVLIQIGVIGAICFWCMVSAGLSVVIFMAALWAWREPSH